MHTTDESLAARIAQIRHDRDAGHLTTAEAEELINAELVYCALHEIAGPGQDGEPQ